MTTKKEYINHNDFGIRNFLEAADIAKLSPEEKAKYEEGLKVYRDLKNVIDTPFSDGIIEGKKIEKTEWKIEGIIKSLKRGKLSLEEIAEIFSVSIDFVIQIKKENST